LKAVSLKYKRVVLKISGEVLPEPGSNGLDFTEIKSLGEEIKEIKKLGVEVAVVLGAGNIIRGKEIKERGISRVQVDYLGMLATVVNSLSFQLFLQKQKIPVSVLSAFEIQPVVTRYTVEKAISCLKAGQVVILAGGLGIPYLTTDTTAALRAAEIKAEAVLKATKVDGIYSDDPLKNKKAKKYSSLTYLEVLKKNLQVMDLTAVSLCRENSIPIIVFNLRKKGNIKKVVLGQDVGTKVENEEKIL
jgi:uridylate kinase